MNQIKKISLYVSVIALAVLILIFFIVSKNFLFLILFFIYLIVAAVGFYFLFEYFQDLSNQEVFLKRYKAVYFFKINYSKNKVVFLNQPFLDSKAMSLQEFAIRILKMDTNSSELAAMMIGKLDFNKYKENFDYKIKIISVGRKRCIGYIEE